MARIKGIQEFVETSATESITPPLPDHLAGDLLLVFAVGDNVISSFSAAGWTIGGQQQSAGTTTAACRAAWIYKLAASANESITITSSSTTWTVTALALDGVDQSTPIDASNTNGILINANPGTGTAFSAASITTTTSKALVLYTMFNSSGAPSPFPGVRTVSSHDSGLTGIGIGSYIQPTVGAAGTWDFYTENHASVDQNSVSFTIAIRDIGTSASRIPAYLNKDHADMVTPLRGATPSIRGETWNISNSTLYGNVPQIGRRLNKKVVHYDDSTDTFTEITSAANNAISGDFNLLGGTPESNDYIAFCADAPFASLSGLHTTLGEGGTSTWEVLNGSTWTELSVTFGYWLSTNWTTFTWPAAPVAAKYSMVIAPADLRRISAIWKTSTLNGTSGYWIRNKFSIVPDVVPTCTYIVPSEGPTFYDAIGSTTDSGANAFHNSSASTPSTYSPSVPGLSGTYITLGGGIGPYTATDKILVGTWTFGTPRDYVDAGARSELSGVAVSLFDATWNDRTYYIGGYQVTDTDQNARNIFAIQWDADITTYNNLGTELSDISAVGVFSRQLRGPGIQNFNQLVAYSIPKLSGGTTTNPILLDEFLDTFSVKYYYPLPLIFNNVAIIPIQIGGQDPVHAEIDSISLTFAELTTEPDAFDNNAKCSFHIDENYLGLLFDGRSGDSIKLVNSSISSPNSWRFEFLSTASNLCTWDFSNTTVVNAVVTLKNVTTFDSMTFRNCSSLDITNCVINNTVFQSCATVAAAGATLTQNIFAATTGTNALTVASVEEINKVDTTRFWNNPVAIKITAPGTYDLDAISFSGNTVDIENASNGLVTIRNINGSNAETFTNTAGGTTVIVEPFTFEVTNIISGTEVRILRQSDLVELASVEVVSATPSGVSNATVSVDPDNSSKYVVSYAYDYTTDVPVFVVIYNTEYKALRVPYILKGADSVLQAAQQFDRQYQNPA
jgi:hypothetical protein